MDTLHAACCDIFTEQNVLSAMFHQSSEGYPHAHILVYPADTEGYLNASKWIADTDRDKNGKEGTEGANPEGEAAQGNGSSTDGSNVTGGIDPYAGTGSIPATTGTRQEYDLGKQVRLLPAYEKQILDVLHEAGFGEWKEDLKAQTVSDDLPFLNAPGVYRSSMPRTEADDKEQMYDAKYVSNIGASEMPFEKQEAVLDSILEYFNSVEATTLSRAQCGQMKESDLWDEVLDFMKRNHPDLEAYEIETMKQRVHNAVYGYYVLDNLINDDTISDIKVLSPDRIRIKRYGERYTSNLSFRNLADYNRFVYGVAVRNRSNISAENAVQNFTDKYTNPNFILRINICTPYVNSVNFPYLHIRKVAKEKRTMEYLLKAGMLDLKTAGYLIDQAKTSTGIIFTGKGASGKTTLMNCLLDQIPFNRSGLVIQENEELFSMVHPDLMFQHVHTSRTLGMPQFDLQDLARNGLLTDLDYFIIGEIKGGEALYFLNASYTGHQCWASVHGSSSTEAMNKLADYVKYASDYSRGDILRMLHTMKVVVYMRNFKVWEISEVVGFDEERQDLEYKTVFSYEKGIGVA